MSPAPEGLVQSVQTRLLNHARSVGADPNAILARYGLERFLYRLARSEQADRFVLKGAMLLRVWLGETARPTRDADLLGYGDLSTAEIERIFRQTCDVSVEPDGVSYLPTLPPFETRLPGAARRSVQSCRRPSPPPLAATATSRTSGEASCGRAGWPEPLWILRSRSMLSPPFWRRSSPHWAPARGSRATGPQAGPGAPQPTRASLDSRGILGHPGLSPSEGHPEPGVPG